MRTFFTDNKTSGYRPALIAAVVLLAMILFRGHAHCGTDANEKVRNVLILNSYNKGMKWTDDIVEAIESSLGASFKKIDICIEYMDVKRYSGNDYFQALYEFYIVKFKPKAFDVIITSDDDAFNFAYAHQDGLFNGSPIVFCGVNFFHDSLISGGRKITGVVEALDIKKTVETASRLHAPVSRVAVINDRTTTGVANRRAIEKIMPEFSKDVSFDFYEDLTMDEALRTVSKFEKGTLVLLMTFNRARDGKAFTYEESAKMISERSKVPVYGVWDFLLGHGIVGGVLTTGKSQGETAASLAARILNGESADKIKIISESPNVCMFDYNKLLEFEVPLSALPENHVTINMPFSFYSIDKKIFWAVFSTVLVMFATTLLLAVNVLKRKRVEAELVNANAKMEIMIGQLENMVDIRTRELKNSNESLQAEIIERKKIAEELKDREFKYRMLTENTYDMICEIDLEGNLLYISPNVFENLGYRAEESINKKYYQFIHPDDIEKVKKEFNNTTEKITETSNEMVEARFLHKNGHYLIFESSGRSFKSASGPMHNVIVSRNVTLKKKIESEMIKSTKLESVGILAGGIAHDFNNILMGIVGNIAIAKKSIPHEEKSYEVLMRAEKIAHRAKNLTEQLITFSKGGYPVKQVIVINNLVKESVQFAMAGSTDICKFDFDEKLWPVEIDEGQLTQVITNLVINAKQAMTGDGIIEIKTENVDIREYAPLLITPGKYTRISVKDSGSGIAPEHLGLIFDPYFTTKPAGNGLGLAVAYSIIKNHMGIIKVESQPGAGTTFYIYLPAKL